MHLRDIKKDKQKGYLPITCLFSLDILQFLLHAKNFKSIQAESHM